MVGKKILVGVYSVYYGSRKMEKAMAKALERQSDIIWHLFMKIMEIRTKGR